MKVLAKKSIVVANSSSEAQIKQQEEKRHENNLCHRNHFAFGWLRFRASPYPSRNSRSRPVR
jgi:hypothetical protein